MTFVDKSKWAFVGLGVWLTSTACTAIIGVSDLPPATEVDGGTRETGGSDGGTHDGGGREGGGPDANVRDATHPDAPADALSDGGVDAQDAAVHDTGIDVPLPPFAVSPASLAFGDAGGKLGFVACGSAGAPTRQLTLRNTTSQAISWWASLGAGAASPYALSTSCTPTATCTLEAGDAGTKVVTITGPLVASDAGSQTYDDTLTLFSTAAGEAPVTVALTASSYGAVLAFSQPNVAFGAQPANQPDGGYRQTLQLENNGSAPFVGGLAVRSSADASVDASTTTRFELARIADAAVGADATLIAVPGSAETPFTLSFDPAGSTAEAGAVLVVEQPQPNVLCAPLPTAVSLTGHGTSSPISISPSTLNFNAGENNGIGVSCGTAGAPATITVTNTSTSVGSIELRLGTTSFTLPTTPIPLPAATAGGPGVASILVTPNDIPASAVPGTSYGDTLTIITNVPGDLPHAVPLQMTAAGVVLSIPYTTVVAQSTPAGERSQAYLYVTNSGNVQVGTLSTTNTNDTVFQWQPQPLEAFSERQLQLSFAAPAGATEVSTATSTLTVPTGTPICSPPVAGGTPFDGTLTIDLSGYGATTVYDQIQAPPYLQTNNARCASQATAAETTPATSFRVQIGNDTSASCQWTAVLKGHDASFFSLSASGGSLTTASNAATIVLTYDALSSSSGLSASQVALGLNAAVTLTVTDAANHVQTQDVAVWEQVSGAYLVWGQSEILVPSMSATGLTLYNWDARSDLVSVTSSAAVFPLAAAQSNPRLNLPFTGTVSDDGAGSLATGTIGVTVGSSVPLCGPLPGALDVSLAP